MNESEKARLEHVVPNSFPSRRERSCTSTRPQKRFYVHRELEM